MAQVNCCDVCGAKYVDSFSFKTGVVRDPYESRDLCGACASLVLRRFSHIANVDVNQGLVALIDEMAAKE